VTISELQQRLPTINWHHFISTFLPKGLDINEEEVVIVSVPPQLVSLLRLIEMTDEKTLVNYLMWRTASSILPYLGESATKLRLHFNAKITGQLQKPPKWEECVGLVTTTLAHAVGKLYVQKYFKENSRTEAIKMFQDIHESFQSVLEEAEWMDPGTK
jgi:membrane metallo-endopeptidase-like protein 1